MQFKIRLLQTMGDEKLEAAAIIMKDKNGQEDPDQMILSGETVECTATLAQGASLIIREMERPVTYDQEQKSSTLVDLTQGQRRLPPTEATPKAPLPSAPATPKEEATKHPPSVTPAAGHTQAPTRK